ncbi:hypothetical protein OS493_020576 [Desmophyllum pertusum]|uniref:Uncharacterized protein n=1 Tax=Desmophyllum pertusum TaxID=174260 RepID=A0A9X0CQP7_9CNID|nr:hypothetical protein OS493_020576 [Desmophyllum pertusum]
MSYITVKGSFLLLAFGKVEDFKEILAEIGKVALECLLKDDHVFEYDQLSAAILVKKSHYWPTSSFPSTLKICNQQDDVSLQGNLGGIEEHVPTLKIVRPWIMFSVHLWLSDDGAVRFLTT